MSEQAPVADLDLTALIASRICHDVISPVGAISNGLEMLADETDEEMREMAMQLIVKSAQQASAKLQFARLAFGAAGSAGAEIDLRDAERVAKDFVQGKHTLTWQGPIVNLPKNKVKLLLNLVALGVTALPRGGTVAVAIAEDGGSFTITSTGDVARLPEEVAALLTGQSAEAIDAHSILPYYARRVGEAVSMRVAVESGDGTVVLRAS